MLKNTNIICISSIDWDFIWQGHQEIMSTFVKNGNRVIFIENTGVRMPEMRDMSRIKSRIKNWIRGVKGIRKEMENLYVFSPLVLPFPYFRPARWLNRHMILSVLKKWMKAADFSDPVIMTFLPTPLSSDIIDNLTKKLVVYYCIDNFSASSSAAKKIKKSEKILLKKSDLVFVTSKELYNYCSKYNDKVQSFPFAVNFDKFEKFRLGTDVAPAELKNIKRPIIGYVGGVHKWIDQNLIKKMAEICPECSFVFVGPLQTDVSLLAVLKNVHFLGSKYHKDIPVYIKYFDACIIPYLITDYTKNVYPTKLNEYLAMGKAVISTPLPEVLDFNRNYNDIVYVANDADNFIKHIRVNIATIDEKNVKSRIETARSNSWDSRISQMSGLMENEIDRKISNADDRWKENLIYLYKTAKRKILKFSAICILFYAIIFKTSFVWFLASPLKISQSPQNANAIVVFGGGVGETGSPGKSTIERARYAVALYKNGYANYIVFSSGYTYKYNDAENMKIFAVSMGVPEKNIILEDKSSSAYENVKFSKKILDEKGWDSILLVSSQYNMRRVSLLFRKYGSRLKILYLPVIENQFFDRTEGVQLEQINAIFHEYAGIVYYWWKNYI